MEEFDVSGWWWLPDDADNKVPGILTFSNEDGVRLKLIGSLKEWTQIGSVGDYPLIVGSTEGGKPVTLFDVMELASRVVLPGGTSSQKLWARVGCMGAHFAKQEEACFRKATVEYTYLPDWVGISGFRPAPDMEDGVLRRYELAYTFPDEVKAAIPGGEVCVTYGFQTAGDLLREASLRQSISFRVDLGRNLTFDEWMSDFVSPFANFLTLATSRANAVTALSVYSVDKTVSTSKGEREVPIELFYQPSWHEKLQTKRLSPYDMLFTLHDVADDFGDIVKRWLRVASELDSVCNLFFNVKYLPGLRSGHQFLNLSQAAESYHRRRIRSRVLPRQRHRERVRSILDQAPAEHRDWLKEVISHRNEPGLRERITDLLDLTQEVVSRLVGDEDRFIAKVVDTRNYFTHYDPRLRTKAATGTELHYLSQVLSFMVEACLLRELGITPERYRQLFERNQRYVYAITHPGQADWQVRRVSSPP